MALIRFAGVRLAYGVEPLLDGVDLSLERGERACLLGRNGAGKSTLLRLLEGSIAPDEGAVERRPGLRVALLQQEVPRDLGGTVLEVVRGGLSSDDAEGERRAEELVSRVGLEHDAAVDRLSAGNRRRVLLARALASGPDLLLLDEPTNHLDLEAIERLEDLLLRRQEALVFVTHDRAFLGRLATRILELDRGRLSAHDGSYRSYLARREAELAAEEAAWARQDKRLAVEEAWLRRTPEARRTRNEGRARALDRMRAERRERRARPGEARIGIEQAERSGKLVLESAGLSVGYGAAPVVRDLDLLVMRGDKVGIVGPNGCGKTTLLRALLGEIAPSAGTVRQGTRLEVAVFDQLRLALDEARSVADNVSDGAEFLEIGGRRRHVLGWLEDFLFEPARARSPVAALSGGERNRLLLARLFARPSNVLVLDEPTNDLDLETLELLEQQLVAYAGTVLVVSHDRTFLDNVVTSTLAHEGEGRFVEYAGGYSDWQTQRRAPVAAARAEPTDNKRPRRAAPRRLTFKEQRELDALPAAIEALELEQRALEARLSDPSFYQRDGGEIAAAKARLEQLGDELERGFARWQELEHVAAARS